jgi:nicotinamidase-related amidase
MRTAYEKGFNVVTLTDCTAATSEEAQAASTAGTYGMFSRPMTKDEFLAELEAAKATAE